ncbi:MAG TPA: hypothetical protein VE999_02805 [Gemmataceae bacterium]|nr:hypothetical protein [Gemmataceae bacterium]
MDYLPWMFDPAAPVPRMQALARLPWLVYRLFRWCSWRGGWLADYLRHHRPFDRRAFSPDQPIDIMVLYADHFEPARRFGDAAAIESVRSWCQEYENMAAGHHDADGRPPQHTWFYRYDYPNSGCMQALSDCVFRGFGEVEFHLHHGYDTHESMLATLRSGLDWFNRFGSMRTAEAIPQQRYAYLAGNSALDNGARDDSLSGCPTELRALRDTGCYADFTFPSLGSRAQPRLTNCIYYAREDGRPKSYDSGVPVEAGKPGQGDILMFQGPVFIDWRHGCFEEAALENTSPPHPRRMAAWLSANVHVHGRPEWIFLKFQTHGMQNRASFLSPSNEALLTAMEREWNRPPFRLHYVTAREAYNIVKAAQAGKSGDPNAFRDFEIPPPANRLICCDIPWRLLSYAPERVQVELLESKSARLEFAQGSLAAVSGLMRRVEAIYREGQLIDLRIDGEGPYEVVERTAGRAGLRQRPECISRGADATPLSGR